VPVRMPSDRPTPRTSDQGQGLSLRVVLFRHIPESDGSSRADPLVPVPCHRVPRPASDRAQMYVTRQSRCHRENEKMVVGGIPGPRQPKIPPHNRRRRTLPPHLRRAADPDPHPMSLTFRSLLYLFRHRHNRHLSTETFRDPSILPNNAHKATHPVPETGSVGHP
jgi:hypothetical protein